MPAFLPHTYMDIWIIWIWKRMYNNMEMDAKVQSVSNKTKAWEPIRFQWFRICDYWKVGIYMKILQLVSFPFEIQRRMLERKRADAGTTQCCIACQMTSYQRNIVQTVFQPKRDKIYVVSSKMKCQPSTKDIV
jgi:hypothetical protein